MITKLVIKCAIGTAQHTEYSTGIWTLLFDGTAEDFLERITYCSQQACKFYAEERAGIVTQDKNGNYYLDGLSVAVKDLAILYREDIA